MKRIFVALIAATCAATPPFAQDIDGSTDWPICGATFLSDNPDLEVVIVGHTDNQGSMGYNLGLSNRRAEAVRNAWVADYAITADRTIYAGAGFLNP